MGRERGIWKGLEGWCGREKWCKSIIISTNRSNFQLLIHSIICSIFSFPAHHSMGLESDERSDSLVSSASHSCCCGLGSKVYDPSSDLEWQLWWNVIYLHFPMFSLSQEHVVIALFTASSHYSKSCSGSKLLSFIHYPTFFFLSSLQWLTETLPWLLALVSPYVPPAVLPRLL